MDLEAMVKDAGMYMKDAVWGHWRRWILLTVALVVFPVLYGYMMKIYRGGNPPPELEGWGRFFVDGLRYLGISIVYMLPGFLLFLLALVALFAAVAGNSGVPRISVMLVAILGMLIACVLIIIAAVLLYIAIVRGARSGRMRDAFHVGEVLAHIRTIGWGSFIIAFLVGGVISWIGSQIAFSPIFLLLQIPPELLVLLVGGRYAWLLIIILIPLVVVAMFLYVPVIIFTARFQTLVYELGLSASGKVIAPDLPPPGIS